MQLSILHSLASYLLQIGLLLILGFAVYCDTKAHKIPNLLVLFGLIFGLAYQSLSSDGAGGLNWLMGVLAAFACFIPLYMLRGMAAGDVKLMMAVGGLVGYPLVITALICTILIGGVMAVIYALFNRRIRLLVQNLSYMATQLFVKQTSHVDMFDSHVIAHSAGRMPYAMAIAVGTCITLYLQHVGKTF